MMHGQQNVKFNICAISRKIDIFLRVPIVSKMYSVRFII